MNERKLTIWFFTEYAPDTNTLEEINSIIAAATGYVERRVENARLNPKLLPITITKEVS